MEKDTCSLVSDESPGSAEVHWSDEDSWRDFQFVRRDWRFRLQRATVIEDDGTGATTITRTDTYRIRIFFHGVPLWTAEGSLGECLDGLNTALMAVDGRETEEGEIFTISRSKVEVAQIAFASMLAGRWLENATMPTWEMVQHFIKDPEITRIAKVAGILPADAVDGVM